MDMYVVKERILATDDGFDITDDAGYKIFHVDGSRFAADDRVVVEDPLGREVAAVHRYLVSLRPRYEVTVGGEGVDAVRRSLFTPFQERFTIDVPGPDDLEITGDVVDHEYLVERAGRRIAAVSRRWSGRRDSYSVRVVGSEDTLLVLAGALALDLALARLREDEEEADDR